jgi:hypothetical protein
MRIVPFLLSLCFVSLAACADSSDDTSNPADEQDVIANGARLFVATGPGLTGGVSVRALNQAQTRCADSKRAGFCTVAGVDFGALKLTEPQTRALADSFKEGHVIAKGRLTSEKLTATISVDKLVVTEAWVGQTGRALKDGASVFSVSHKIQSAACTGCPAFRQATVNTTQAVDIGKVDFGGVRVDQARLSDVEADMEVGGPGALIAGVDRSLGGKGPEAPTLFADEVYLHAGALSGQRCSDDVAVQARCAPGLECVFLEGGPISEHRAGICNRL